MNPASSPTPVRTFWRRWRFHLSALMVLVPLGYLKSYIDLQDMLLRAKDEHMRSVEVEVGPWRLDMQEFEAEEPYWHPKDGLVKAFRIAPCPECARQIRAIFVSLKRPGSSEYGAEAEGNPYRSFVEMKIGRNPSSGDLVWITAEGWDGSFHQAKLALASASPVTAAWVARQAGTTADR